MKWMPKKGLKIGEPENEPDKDTGKTKNPKKQRAPMLKIPLQHGRFMVMHGAAIQKYYNVCAYILSFLILGMKLTPYDSILSIQRESTGSL